MRVFLIIVAILAILIATLLILPVYIIIKNDQKNNLILSFKFLFWSFGGGKKPESSVTKKLKKSIGANKLSKEKLKNDMKKGGLPATVTETAQILITIFKELSGLLGHCTAKKYELNIICSSEDAAQTAISYGKCCAAAFPLLGLLGSLIRVKKKGRNIDIRCDFTGKQELFRYNFVISTKVFNLLSSFIKVAIKEAKRKSQK